MVYSGQTIEHVTEADGDTVVREAFRVLAPGGWFCLDTPNGPLWRLRSDEPMNHDHKIEYAAAQLVAKLERAGFEVTECKGLNLMREGSAAGRLRRGRGKRAPGRVRRGRGAACCWRWWRASRRDVEGPVPLHGPPVALASSGFTPCMSGGDPAGEARRASW